MNQPAPKHIGKRILVNRTKSELTITILQKIERYQEALLLSWLLGWAFCGGVFVYYLFTTVNSGERIFFLIGSALWLFFFIRILKVFLWRIGGREIITISPGKLTILNAFWNRGKIQQFHIRSIFKLGLIKKSETSFFAFLDDSFWIMGGDRIGFSYSGAKIQFAKQLDLRDAEALARMLEHALSEFGKSAQ